jgi:acetyl esterase
MLDPDARALLQLMDDNAVPAVHTLSPAEARRLYLERRGFSQPEPPDLAEVRDAVLDGVPVRLYRPPTASARVLPVLVYLHGGGWVIGDRDTHDVLCRQLSIGACCAVVSVDYRLAPEHPFPAALEDALTAVRAVWEQAAKLGVDAQRLAVGGDSAGGNLAASVCLALRDAGQRLPAFQLLIYPATDMRAVAPSHEANGQGYLLTHESIAWYRSHYVPDAALWADPRVSPLLASSHAGLPPALVLTAGYDPLRDEGRQYADALSAAGVPTRYVCFERQIHGFLPMGRAIAEANLAVDVCCSALRRAWAAA